MAKVDTVGINTITMPEYMPGTLSGRITLVNTFALLAPRSCAASMSERSIFCKVL